jgi:peptidoglycan/LPS O-acetylase OafA/YrhL
MSPPMRHDRIPTLDGLRAISILLVLACHLLPLGPKSLGLNETAGAMGMSLFFALSGFLITSTLIHNQNVVDFLIRRLARILPLAYLFSFLTLVFIAHNPKALFWTDLFLVNYFTEYLSPGLTEHLWSLCVEMQFYVSIALIVALCGRVGLWLVWPACAVVTFLRIYTGTYIGIATHLRVDEILSGACVAIVVASEWKPKASFLAIVIASVFWFASSNPLTGELQYLRPYASAALVLTTLQFYSDRPASLLASAPMRYIATISYALYIIHPATAYGWMNEGAPAIKYLAKRPISFALTFALAHLSTFYWEKPWQVWAKRWLARRNQSSFGVVAKNTTS